MAKLYFRYGVVSSAKTMNLLAVAHNYQVQGKRVLLFKPDFDTRFGENKIRSRTGLETNADLLLRADTIIDRNRCEGVACILVDEVQFLAPQIIDQLREITVDLGVPVICYGLRSDFRGHLFPATQRLFELADTLEEIKTTCYYCNKKALMNLKQVDGKATVEGPSSELNAANSELYFPTCYRCYREQLQRHL